ncbi:hypothetical protein cypCar_00047796 [Cyprinus carpio]|nr:hypothetical protein cypCar_00047796 [Cyprinus carpio]
MHEELEHSEQERKYLRPPKQGLWSDGYRGLCWPNPGHYPASLSPPPPSACSSQRKFVNVNNAHVFLPALVVLKHVHCLLQARCGGWKMKMRPTSLRVPLTPGRALSRRSHISDGGRRI